MRIVAIGLILGLAGKWEKVSCWILSFTSLLDTVAIILIVRARATERKGKVLLF